MKKSKKDNSAIPYSLYSEIRDGKPPIHLVIFIQISIYTTYTIINDIRIMTIFETGYAYPHTRWQYQLHMGQVHGNVQECDRNQSFSSCIPNVSEYSSRLSYIQEVNRYSPEDTCNGLCKMRSYLVQYSKLIKAFSMFLPSCACVPCSKIALNVMTQFILQRFSRNTQSFKVTNLEV